MMQVAWQLLLACGVCGFGGALLWAAWSRVWDWAVGAPAPVTKEFVDEIDHSTAAVLVGHIVQLEAHAERLDKLEEIAYNRPKVAYGSQVPSRGSDAPTCW